MKGNPNLLKKWTKRIIPCNLTMREVLERGREGDTLKTDPRTAGQGLLRDVLPSAQRVSVGTGQSIQSQWLFQTWLPALFFQISGEWGFTASPVDQC